MNFLNSRLLNGSLERYSKYLRENVVLMADEDQENIEELKRKEAKRLKEEEADKRFDDYQKIKDTPIGIPFDTFLVNCTNHITVFAIFNALIAYANSLKNESDLLSFILFSSFYGLSVLVWFRILRMSMRDSDEGTSYMVFQCCAIFIQFALTWLYVEYNPLLFILCVLYILPPVLAITLSFYIQKFFFLKRLKKLSPRRRHHFIGRFHLITMLIVGATFVITIKSLPDSVNDAVRDKVKLMLQNLSKEADEPAL